MEAFLLEKLELVRTKQYIADLLQAEILSGQLADGQILVQSEIAQQMNVSRIPVREAFQQLEQSGFLVRISGRHVCVCGLTPRRLRQLVDLFWKLVSTLLQDIPDAAGEYLESATSEEEFFLRLTRIIDNHHVTVHLMRTWRDYIRLISVDRASERVKLLCEAGSAVKNGDLERVQDQMRQFGQLLINDIPGDDTPNK